jgi:hypothetical protein
MARDTRPMPREDAPTELVALAEPHSSHTGAFEAEVEAADSGE